MQQYIITKNVSGFTYYYGESYWEGLINNAKKMSAEIAQDEARQYYKTDKTIQVKPFKINNK